MTSSLRSRLRGSRPTTSHRAGDPEERFAQRVTLLFIALIVAVIAIVVIALANDFWTQHFKAVATVGGTSITRDQWADRAKLEFFRLQQQEQDVRELISAGDITAEEGNSRITSIESAKGNVASNSIETLIDLAWKGQLAVGQGVTVSDTEVTAAIADEATSPEARQISIIAIEPEFEGQSPTPKDLQAAFSAAQDAAAALAAGTPFADVARQYSTDESKDEGGAYGFVSRDSTLDAAFIGAIFELEEGGVTPVIKDADGSWRIGTVTAIRPGTLDAGLERKLREDVGWDLYRAQVRSEVLAANLEDKIVADATAGDVEQVNLSEIFLEGDTTLAPDEDEGTIHASHILYSPNDGLDTTSLAEDDPAWTAAQEEAQKTADDLRAITDLSAREAAFKERAKESDDPGGATNGGDLGFFGRTAMVAEFGDPLFENAALVPGDIVGPVKSQYGWHVILFQERTLGLQARLDAVVAKLDADGADFAAIATELSEGAEAPAGGALGWLTRAQLDEEAADAVFALEPGAVSEPIPLGDGYHIYRVTEKAVRPLDIQQRAVLTDTAFADWYDPQKTAAEEDKRITRDSEIFSNAPEVGS